MHSVLTKLQETINLNTMWLQNLKSTEAIIKNPKTLTHPDVVQVQTILFDIQDAYEHVEIIHQHHIHRSCAGTVLRIFINGFELVFNYREYIGDVNNRYWTVELQNLFLDLRMYTCTSSTSTTGSTEIY